MKALTWIVRLLLFFAALTFALKNTDAVTVRYYLGLQWQAPLVLVLLIAFFLGGIAGVLLTLPPVVRLRRQVSRLRKHAAAAPAPVVDEPKQLPGAL